MKNKALPLVSIITVNYNGRQFLKECFASLSVLNYPKNKLEIFMVDNGSSDGSVEYVRKKFPTIKIIINNENNYAKANNLGIKQAKGKYIALINNDVKVDRNWLIELSKATDNDGKIGVLGSKILFPNGKLQGTGHYEFPNFYWADRGFKEKDKGQYSETQEMKSLSHCAILYRRKCLDSIGLLDEDFNMFVEDVDMSIRARKKGWRLIYVPKAIAYHKFHGSAKDEFVNFYCEKNRLLLIAKHYPQKLADALFGRGYFTTLCNRNELIKILPYVFAKLVKHHDKKTVISVLPAIFEELNKILNLEKNYLIDQLDNLKNIHSDLLQKTISQKDQLLQQANSDIARMQDNLTQHASLLSQKDQLLQQANSDIARMQDKLTQQASLLSQKDQQLFRGDRMLQGKDTQISTLQDKINHTLNLLSQKDQQLFERDQMLQGKDTQISTLQDKINHTLNLLSQKDQLLQQANSDIARMQDNLTQHASLLSQKDQSIQNRDIEIVNLNAEINGIYHSETYKFIARPIWKILDTFKSLWIKPEAISHRTETLVIKPYCVSSDETERALEYLQKSASKQKIVLVANLFEEDYARLLSNKNIYEKIFYCPSRNRLNITELVKLIFRIRKRRFSEGILLIGNPDYQGYRKGKLLTIFCGARNRNVYFVRAGKIEPLHSLNCKVAIWDLLYGNMLLFFVVFLFLVFVVIPLKMKKVFRK